MWSRQSSAAYRLYSSFKQQRKLFLLVFLWTCLCLFIFKWSLLNASGSGQANEQQGDADYHGQKWLFARSPLASPPPATPPLYLAPEFALPDNSNNNALYYAISSSTSHHQLIAEVEPKQQQKQRPKQRVQPAEPEAHGSGKVPQPPPVAIVAEESQLEGSECSYKYPNLLDLQFNNIHWQRMSNAWRPSNATKSGHKPAASSKSQLAATFYLYNAYYDDRWRGGLPSVRILAMIDRIQPPPTNCLLWSKRQEPSSAATPILTRASFVYAWYPKWGNYKDGLLQPWIVTCPVPRSHVGLVPDSVSLVQVPNEIADDESQRRKRDAPASGQQQAPVGASSAASIAMPPPFSSSSSSSSPASESAPAKQREATGSDSQQAEAEKRYDCESTLPLSNNLPVSNRRPAVKGKFAVCVKGLDFPHEDVSVRLVEWIELLNLLGAGKIFLYNLDVHENISRVLHYYQKRGIVELSPLTLPGDQPNLPEYQHLYLKSKLTAKRQNELIPYNDCLYRNLNSYQYLALLDIDEIIMPLRHRNWHELMEEVESDSLREQNYSRASYNVRNVYFFDDLAGPLGTTSSSSSSSSAAPQSNSLQPAEGSGDEPQVAVAGADQQEDSETGSDSLERGIPHYLHMMQHVYRSKNYTKPGQYVKCFHNTERVVSLHNHFPMNCFGQCTTYSVPVQLAHLQHYRKDCVGPLKQSCKSDFRVFTTRDTTIWKYKQQMIRRTTRVLNQLNLL